MYRLPTECFFIKMRTVVFLQLEFRLLYQNLIENLLQLGTLFIENIIEMHTFSSKYN